MLSPTLLKKRLRLVPPDFADRRGERELLVWKDAPYWMVADEGLGQFLRGLDGRQTLGEALAGLQGGAASRRTAKKAIADLKRRGCLQNSSAAARRHIQYQRADPIPIENVSVNLTRRSNQRCLYCNVNGAGNGAEGEPARGSEVEANEVIALLKSARGLLSKNPLLVLLGGEPLLRPDVVVDLAAYGWKHRFDVIVSTNGSLVTKDFARIASRTGLQVQVSVDGPSAELHDAARGRGTFDLAVAGVKMLAAKRVRTILSCVCHEGNLYFLERYYELAASLDVDEVRFVPMKLLGRARSAPFTPVSATLLMKEARVLFERRPEFLQFAGRDAFSIFGAACRSSSRRRSCGTGLQSFLIDADGSLYPCVNSCRPEFRAGNIRDPGFEFERVWRTSSVLAEYRSKTAVDRENGGCAGCLVRYWCLGGCRGETYAATGKLEDRSPECKDLRSATLEMFWTLSERPDLFREERGYC